jgi:DNA-directed RNA polymerase specialized sigma24 family protein
MFRKTKHQATERTSQYANDCDFSVIFQEEAQRLYLLALLLTSDHSRAEACIVAGLEDCIEGNAVFKDWARAWSMRMVIKRAIQMVVPNPLQKTGGPALTPLPETSVGAQALLAAVTPMSAFDRFVFVLSVLEGYSDRDCSTLLSCPQSLIAASRVRTLQQVKPLEAGAAESPADCKLRSLALSTVA